MRISDWSSDVCSSDPHESGGNGAPQACGHGQHDDDDDDAPSAMPHEKARTPRIPGGQSVKALLHKTEQAGRGAVRRFDEQRAQSGARNSGVSGKSVSVRVDLGGARLIENKKEIPSARKVLSR